VTGEMRRTLLAVARKLVFAGLTILGVWLLILALRAIATPIVIDLMSESPLVRDGVTPDYNDWGTSYWMGKTVSELIGQRIGVTLRLVGFGGLLALGIAGLLLFLGVLLSRTTRRPLWLANIRSVLRLIIVSGAVGNPILLGAFLGMIFIFPLFRSLPWSPAPPPSSQAISVWLVLHVSLLPAWLLVQAGHGELSKSFQSHWQLATHLAATSVMRLLKLAGAVFVVAVLAEQGSSSPGLGRLLLQAIDTRDMPVAFGIAFILAVIVVLAKLTADLIGIAYNHSRKNVTARNAATQGPSQRLPTGWVVFSLVLVVLFILAAIFGPFMAPYGYNEIQLNDRLSPPSPSHLLGTDDLGRDVFSRLLFAIRLDVVSSLSIVAALIVVATAWALLATVARNRNDWLGDTLEEGVMLPRDVVGAFPWLVLLLVLISLVGPGVLAVALMTAIVLLPHVVGMMRESSISGPSGSGWVRCVLLSVSPVFLLAMAGAILCITSASYLGFGVPPPLPELGTILSGAGRMYFLQAPWMAQWPIVVLVALMLVWVMAGDAVLERLGFRSKAVWSKAME